MPVGVVGQAPTVATAEHVGSWRQAPAIIQQGGLGQSHQPAGERGSLQLSASPDCCVVLVACLLWAAGCCSSCCCGRMLVPPPSATLEGCCRHWQQPSWVSSNTAQRRTARHSTAHCNSAGLYGTPQHSMSQQLLCVNTTTVVVQGVCNVCGLG